VTILLNSQLISAYSVVTPEEHYLSNLMSTDEPNQFSVSVIELGDFKKKGVVLVDIMNGETYFELFSNDE